MRKKTITEKPRKTPKWLVYSYWLIPVALFFVQYLFTTSSMTHIRYEEVAESIRNPYWLKHGYILDGISGNIGWYGTMAILYKFFGFSIFYAKTFRLIFHLVSLFALAEVLRRWMGPKYALVPLVAAGISPVWLYFNTLQASFGIDLQFLPLILLVFMSFQFRFTVKNALLQFVTGALCMIACMSYPTFLLYLPFLLIAGFWKWMAEQSRKISMLLVSLLIVIAGFAMPLLTGYSYVKNRELLIYDKATEAGMFRGGGKFEANYEVLKTSVNQTMSDLVGPGTSYYFDLPCPDLAGGLAITSLLIALACGFGMGWRNKNHLFLISLLTAFTLFNLLFPSLSSHLPGLRRSTGVIAGIYGLFAVSWYITVTKLATGKNIILQITATLLFLLLPYSNLLNLKQNIEACAKESPWDDPWFKFEKTPETSLLKIIEFVKQGRPLACIDASGKQGPCRYHEIFAAVSGNQEWNHLPMIQIKGVDWRSGKEVVLSMDSWQKNEFP
jgi:hypothetical protein